MTTYNKISVIIPARESEATVRETVKSLLAQSCRPFEIIIVASSNDSTRSAIRDYIKNRTVKYIEIKPGKSYTRDAHLKRWVGANRAKGRYIFFTDSKATLKKDALKLAIKLSKQYKVEVVAGTAVSWQEDSGLLISKLQDKALIKNNPDFPFFGKLNINNFGNTESLPVTTALLLSKKAFNSIKKDFGLNFSKEASTYDDYVISWLLVKNGFEILVTNQVVSYHKHRIRWKQYFRQISRSGQSAALMLKYYPDCPFAKRRNFQVHAVLVLSLFILLLSVFTVFTKGLIGFVTIPAFVLFGLIVAGLVNVFIEKDFYTFFLPPITCALIYDFSIHFFKWRYFMNKNKTDQVLRYFQLH
ncbi:glycosyltransferase [Patescibacteria group bacterium]|nr:glycosyltransferase [Patescibacteria group bacterium]MCG2701745.1 glycosyltransferase [Candidatus Parcubacteria bacterium]MBU4264650.1 glycosyltransferase [Patescibacteria group bacterium]MBU4390605.1 glycosyltransferase [Patescibacteria group bacterium]MBU4397513.1 glycosyltransferase [Patescibacteria group bacterium]